MGVAVGDFADPVEAACGLMEALALGLVVEPSRGRNVSGLVDHVVGPACFSAA